MIIGIPRERKQGERRVAITPKGVERLSSLGHKVIIETNAGELSGFINEEYKSAGAGIIDTLEEVWGRAELLVKVKEPASEEIKFFREDLTVFCFLHHAAFPELTDAMLKSKVTGLDYDLVTLEDGTLPILKPMSIVAGKLSIQCGATALQASYGGRGILLGGLDGVKPGNVVVVGAGAAGSSAAWVAHGIGANVTVIDINESRLTTFLNTSERMQALLSSPETLDKAIIEADLVIGSVLVPGDQAPKLLTRDMLTRMRKGTVIVDICIDQGGFAESSRSTSIAEPTYIEDGVVHYCVPNMPALVPRTSTMALTAETIKWIELIAEKGVAGAIKSSNPLEKSLTTLKGNLTNQIIGKVLGIPSISKEESAALL